MKSMLTKYEDCFEDPECLLRRGDNVRKFLLEYRRVNPLQDGQKYGIVCHSMMIATLTAKGLDKTNERGFYGYTWCDNCQLLPFKAEMN